MVCQGFIGPFNPYVVPHVAERQSLPERGPDRLLGSPVNVRPVSSFTDYGSLGGRFVDIRRMREAFMRKYGQPPQTLRRLAKAY